MPIRPLHDRVLIQRVEEEQKTAGGIIIPDSAQEKPAKGKIVAVGSGTKNEDGKTVALDVKVGDAVLFAKWGGAEIKIDGEDMVIMRESDIIAIDEDA